MDKHLCRRMNRRGFSLLELMVTMGIIAVVLAVTRPSYETWQVKRSLKTAYEDMRKELTDSRTEAVTRDTTVRIVTTRSGNIYTLTSYYRSTPSTSCSTSGSWASLNTRTIDLIDRFEMTGSGIGTLCFYRDGSSSGGTYTLEQKDGGSDYGAASIEVTIATGYLDATISTGN